MIEEQQRELLRYEQQLVEREQALNKQQLQFYSHAERIMHQLYQDGYAGGAIGGLTPSALEKSRECLLAAATPLPTSTSPHFALGSEDSGYQWRQGGGAIATPSYRHQVPDQLCLVGSPGSITSHGSTSSFADMHTPVPHLPQIQNSFNLPSINHPSIPTFANSPDCSPIFRVPSPRVPPHLPSPSGSSTSNDGRHHSPTNCLPFSCHSSLDEHNVQFYQRQQQQQPLYGASRTGRRLLAGSRTASNSLGNGLLSSNTETIASSLNRLMATNNFDLMDM